jgi:hypothetical protein
MYKLNWKKVDLTHSSAVGHGPIINEIIYDNFVVEQASDSRPESAYAYNSDPFIHAAVTGDVLADQDEEKKNSTDTPQFSMWR